MSRRAESLADRIEEGAAGLAAFAEGLSEEEWRKPASTTDRRSVGVIVHHVANMYPIEIDAARAIASGKAVTDVRWGVVAEINAKHAQEQAGEPKPPRSSSCAGTAARQPTPCARSQTMSWTMRRPSR